MTREQLEHVLRAAAGITGEYQFVIVGSQAALLQHPSLPPAMALSPELDLYPRFRPELAEVIEGAIGMDSLFHLTFGYHADGVAPETSRLPSSWESRAVEYSIVRGGETISAVGPEIHDLAVAKLLAGREKDFDWIAAGIAASLLDPSTVAVRLNETNASAAERDLATARLVRLQRTGANP